MSEIETLSQEEEDALSSRVAWNTAHSELGLGWWDARCECGYELEAQNYDVLLAAFEQHWSDTANTDACEIEEMLDMLRAVMDTYWEFKKDDRQDIRTRLGIGGDSEIAICAACAKRIKPEAYGSAALKPSRIERDGRMYHLGCEILWSNEPSP